MYNLFYPKTAGRLVDFMVQNKRRLTLFCSPDFMGGLYKVERDLRGTDVKLDFNISVFTTYTIGLFDKEQPFSQTGKVFIVADATDEVKRLTQLESRYPGVRFIGLMTELVPLLVARRAATIFETQHPRDRSMPHTATILFATPRSGSTVLSDYLGDMGLGDFKEHLREDVVQALAGSYKIDRAAALEMFLKGAAHNGYVGTKIITHFFEDYIRDIGDISVVRGLCKGMKLHVIFLDRSDHIAQTVSAYLASNRGIWHAESDERAQKANEAPGVDYSFDRLFARHVSALRQDGLLSAFKSFFPSAVELNYETDLETFDPVAILKRLTAAGINPPCKIDAYAPELRRLRNAENDEIEKRYYDSLKGIFQIS